MVYVPLAPPPTGVDLDVWDAACAAIRTYCEWHVAPVVEETVIVDGSGGSVQLLPTLRLKTLHSISAGGVTVVDPEWSETGAVRGCWSSKLRGVEASITHGYDTCPADVLAVARAVAATAAAAAGSLGAARFTSGPHSVELNDAAQSGGVALSDMQMAVLDRYKLPPRP